MVVTYWSAQYLNQYWSSQDMTGIDQKVFARLSVAIKTMEIVEELVKFVTFSPLHLKRLL